MPDAQECMSEILTPHNEALMPITMGSPYRVPDYAYRNWDLKYPGEYRANVSYAAEWALGTAEQNALVGRALAEAGFTDFNGLLQQTTARVIAALIDRNPFLQSPVIADIGAGAGGSASAVVKELPVNVRQNTIMILVDLAREKLAVAGQLMKEQGIKYRVLTGLDTEVLRRLPDRSVDILIGVASVHHHARIPFNEYARVLKMGGFAVFADWHHDLWEHPGRVAREFLERLDWPLKEEGLANWRSVYPQALDNPETHTGLTTGEKMAREQIIRFWEGYKKIADGANLGLNAFWPLEGHRPVAKYMQDMIRAGLHPRAVSIHQLERDKIIARNPHQILPDSSLLQVTIGQRCNLR